MMGLTQVRGRVPLDSHKGTPQQCYPMSSSHHTPPVMSPCLSPDVWGRAGLREEDQSDVKPKEVFSWENPRDTQDLQTVQCLLKVWLFFCSIDSNGERSLLDKEPEKGVGIQNTEQRKYTEPQSHPCPAWLWHFAVWLWVVGNSLVPDFCLSKMNHD